MKLLIAAAVILVVLAMEAQSITVPGGVIWRPEERVHRQQRIQQQPSQQRLSRQRLSRQQLQPQASEESVQRVLPNAKPNTPESLQVLSATDPILLLVRVEAVTPQTGTAAPLKYEATYVARNRGAIHTAPLPGYSRSAASINVAPAPGTS